jgi:hypothetical protein
MFASITGTLLIAQRVSFVKPGAQWDQGSCILWEVVLISLEFPAALIQKFAAIPAEFNLVRLNRQQLLLLIFIAGSLFSDLQAFCDHIPLTPNDTYRCRTAPLTSKVAFYIFIQQIYVLNILNMVYILLFFPLQNAVCFITLTYLVPVLFTFYIQDVLKLKKSVAKRLRRVIPFGLGQ